MDIKINKKYKNGFKIRKFILIWFIKLFYQKIPLFICNNLEIKEKINFVDTNLILIITKNYFNINLTRDDILKEINKLKHFIKNRRSAMEKIKNMPQQEITFFDTSLLEAEEKLRDLEN